MPNPNYSFFQPCATSKLAYRDHANKASWVNLEHLSFFKFVVCVYDDRLVDAYFSRSLYRQILGKPVDHRGVERVNPEYYDSFCWVLNDPTPLEQFLKLTR
jgi:E3 ubiquitin-protein ligase HUWE1